MSYAATVKKVDPVVSTIEPYKDVTNEDLNTMFQFGRTPTLTKKFNAIEMKFLDYASEYLYDIYYELREHSKDDAHFSVLDYNGFLEMIMNNISLEQVLDSEEDDVETEYIVDKPNKNIYG